MYQHVDRFVVHRIAPVNGRCLRRQSKFGVLPSSGHILILFVGEEDLRGG